MTEPTRPKTRPRRSGGSRSRAKRSASRSTGVKQRPPRRPSVCVCVPTYNEAENIAAFARALLEQFDSLKLNAVVLVIDDGSPDGTGEIADRLAAADRRVRVLHREEKYGIGPAYLAGFAWARTRRIGTVVQMDCDFSHDPRDLRRLLAASEDADLVLGSRYVRGGRVVNWPWWRRLISRGGSLYARLILGARTRDLTGGFKCFAPGALDRIPLQQVSATGYGFQIETTWRALREGLRVKEVPITFRDRTAGSSKMSGSIAVEAAVMVLRLRREGIRRTLSRLRRGALGVSSRARATRVPSIRWQGAQPWSRSVRALGAALIAVIALGLTVTQLPAAGAALLVAQFAFATAIGVTTLALMLYAWRDDEGLAATEFPESDSPPRHSFSLIVPARHEERVLATTLQRMADLSHPDWEVIVVVGDDDPGTKRVAREATAGDPRFRIIVDKTPVKNKPRALNAALPHCNGDVVGVFDAEDVVAPDVLIAVDRAFQESDADIVQGAVQLMNFQSSWYSVRNVLEYYFWFKSRLHLHARAGYIPLGGNTVFVRRRWLVAGGGWDSDCLAEDCELGARLSAGGARTVVAYNPRLVTREETPSSIQELFRQRTRWNQGFLQVLRKRDWRQLPLGSRALALYTLASPALQALLALSVPLGLALLLVKLPITLALASFVPLAVLTAILLVEIVGLAFFCREFSLKSRPRDYLRLIAGCVPYQLLLSAAALRAAWREISGVNTWEKTAHVGAHL
jgi:cellulose synthase/poly-beta-1,6-N-acetylglucosamine synthase-like glycosyltransferase